jgi:hypothetical protein
MAVCKLSIDFLPKPSSLAMAVKIKPVNTGNIFYKTQFIKLTNIGFSKVFDIHGILTNEMDNPFYYLCPTIDIDTTPYSFSFRFK